MARDYLAVRSVMETPILDERKWAKVPGIPADLWILDMEDSAPPARKEDARRKVVEYLGTPEYFGGAATMARPNHLSTPWGHDDVVALAEAGVQCMLYPKVHTPEDLLEVQELLRRHGADPDAYVCIESARAVVEVERIAAMDKVVGLSFGPGDLSVDSHMAEFEPDGSLNPGYVYPEMRTVLAGVAFGRATVNLNLVPDIKDLQRVRLAVERSKRLGFTSCVAFYPPHIDIINEVFTPSPEEVARATEIVEAYDAARREGRPAVQLANGEVLLVHEYTKAQHLLARAGTRAGAAAG